MAAVTLWHPLAVAGLTGQAFVPGQGVVPALGEGFSQGERTAISLSKKNNFFAPLLEIVEGSPFPGDTDRGIQGPGNVLVQNRQSVGQVVRVLLHRERGQMARLAGDIHLVGHPVISFAVSHKSNGCVAINTFQTGPAEMDIRLHVDEKPIPGKSPPAQSASFMWGAVTGGFKLAQV
jgi:hypothetical protein